MYFSATVTGGQLANQRNLSSRMCFIIKCCQSGNTAWKKWSKEIVWKKCWPKTFATSPGKRSLSWQRQVCCCRPSFLLEPSPLMSFQHFSARSIGVRVINVCSHRCKVHHRRCLYTAFARLTRITRPKTRERRQTCLDASYLPALHSDSEPINLSHKPRERQPDNHTYQTSAAW